MRIELDNKESTLIFKGIQDDEIDLGMFHLVHSTDGGEAAPGPGQTDHKWPRTRSHIRFEDCHRVTIRDPKITGPNKAGGVGTSAAVGALEAQHGLDIEGCTEMQFLGGEISQIYGDIVYCRNSSDITIKGLYGYNNGRQGLALVNSKNIIFMENHLKNIRHAHIDLENNSPDEIIENVIISHNRFGKKRLKWIASAGKGLVQDIQITNNDLYGSGFDCILGRADRKPADKAIRKRFIFTGNKSAYSFGNPQGQIMKLHGCEDFYIGGNEVLAQKGRGMHLVGLYGTCQDIFLGENDVINGTNGVK